MVTVVVVVVVVVVSHCYVQVGVQHLSSIKL